MGAAVWLALAAVGAALLGPSLGPLPVVLGAGALVLASLAGRLQQRHWVRRTDPAAIGLLLIGLRLALAAPASAGPATSLPETDGPWTGTVLTISAPRDGKQPAIVELAAPASLAVAATLPRFPAIVPGDRVTVTG